MRVVLLGATRGMGRAVARKLAERGARLFLLGRNEHEAERSASDLELRGALRPVGWARCDLHHPEGFEVALQAAERALGGFDTVLVTAGLFAPQAELDGDREFRRRLLVANFSGTIEFCDVARERLLANGGGTLCVFSSVAGEQPRKTVIHYGATKAGLSYYLEAIDLAYRSRGLRVLLVKPGFIRTGMTAGLPAPPFAGDPDAVAEQVVTALDRGRSRIFAPPIWRWVALTLRLLPRAVLRRVEF